MASPRVVAQRCIRCHIRPPGSRIRASGPRLSRYGAACRPTSIERRSRATVMAGCFVYLWLESPRAPAAAEQSWLGVVRTRGENRRAHQPQWSWSGLPNDAPVVPRLVGGARSLAEDALIHRAPDAAPEHRD